MSEGPAAMLRDFLLAYNEGEHEAAVANMAPDAQYVPILAAMEGRSFHGREGALEFFRAIDLDWEVFVLEPRDFYEHGDRGLALGTWRAKGRSSGLELSGQPAAWMVVVRDGLIAYARTFMDRDQALEEFGVPAEELEAHRVELA